MVMKHWLGNLIRIAGQPTKPDRLRLGVQYIGVPGGGKSSLNNKQIKDTTYVGDSIVAVDVSNELPDYLAQHAHPETEVKVIDVHHEGGTGIEVAAVLDRPSRHLQFAQKVCPDSKKDKANDYFTGKARFAIMAVLLLLTILRSSGKAKGEWTLADLVRLCFDRELLSAALKQCREIHNPYETLGENDSARDVAGTVENALAPLAIFAALNEHATEKVSPLWALEGKRRVIVLSRDDRLSAATEAMHSFVIDTVAEEALSRLSDERLHIILDEVRALPPINSLGEIIRRGRKSSVCPTISFHSVHGIFDRYGRDVAEEIINLIAHKVFLRTSCVTTAKWASEVLGVTETLQRIDPVGPVQANAQQSVVMRPNVIPDEIRRGLKAASWEKDRIEGWFEFPEETARFECPFRADAFTGTRTVRTPVPKEWEILGRMTVADIDRVGIEYTPQVKKALGL